MQDFAWADIACCDVIARDYRRPIQGFVKH